MLTLPACTTLEVTCVDCIYSCLIKKDRKCCADTRKQWDQQSSNDKERLDAQWRNNYDKVPVHESFHKHSTVSNSLGNNLQQFLRIRVWLPSTVCHTDPNAETSQFLSVYSDLHKKIPPITLNMLHNSGKLVCVLLTFNLHMCQRCVLFDLTIKVL